MHLRRHNWTAIPETGPETSMSNILCGRHAIVAEKAACQGLLKASCFCKMACANQWRVCVCDGNIRRYIHNALQRVHNQSVPVLTTSSATLTMRRSWPITAEGCSTFAGTRAERKRSRQLNLVRSAHASAWETPSAALATRPSTNLGSSEFINPACTAYTSKLPKICNAHSPFGRNARC